MRGTEIRIHSVGCSSILRSRSGLHQHSCGVRRVSSVRYCDACLRFVAWFLCWSHSVWLQYLQVQIQLRNFLQSTFGSGSLSCSSLGLCVGRLDWIHLPLLRWCDPIRARCTGPLFVRVGFGLIVAECMLNLPAVALMAEKHTDTRYPYVSQPLFYLCCHRKEILRVGTGIRNRQIPLNVLKCSV